MPPSESITVHAQSEIKVYYEMWRDSEAEFDLTVNTHSLHLGFSDS